MEKFQIVKAPILQTSGSLKMEDPVLSRPFIARTLLHWQGRRGKSLNGLPRSRL